MDTSNRIQRIREYMEHAGLGACVLSSPENMQYLSGFQAITYSRPIVFVVDFETTHLIIPALEEAHAHLESTGVEHLHVYYEHPEKAGIAASPLEHLQRVLQGKARVGVEFGATNLKTAEALRGFGAALHDVGGLLTRMRYRKDEQEKQYLREAGRLCQYAFEKSLEHARVGISEMEFEQYGTEALYRLMGDDYPYAFSSPGCITPSGPCRTVMPHVFSSTRRFQNGDMAIHVRKPAVNGYYAELERSFFIGEPGEKARRAFCAMQEAQQTVMEAVRPGVTAAQLDKLGRDVLRKYGYEEYAIHRIGHGQGLGRHEEPFLIFSSSLALEESMVFTIEPGIYIPGVGGFRHSDTIIVTKDGYENITSFPSSLEKLTFK